MTKPKAYNHEYSGATISFPSKDVAAAYIVRVMKDYGHGIMVAARDTRNEALFIPLTRGINDALFTAAAHAIGGTSTKVTTDIYKDRNDHDYYAMTITGGAGKAIRQAIEEKRGKPLPDCDECPAPRGGYLDLDH